MKEYFLLVAGSRDSIDESNIHKKLDEATRVLPKLKPSHKIVIVSGMARGVDSFAVNWANKRGVKIIEKPADWDKYGKSAGYVRNKEMAKICNSALIFWDGESRGTNHMMSLLDKAKTNYCMFDRNNVLVKKVIF